MYMLGSKRILAVLAFIAVFTLSGCMQAVELIGRETGTVDSAISQGLISPIEARTEDRGFTFLEVQRGALQRQVIMPVNVSFRNIEHLSFENYGGIYSGTFVGVPGFPGTRVYAGERLAEQVLRATELQLIDRDILAREIVLFENQFAEENIRWEQDLSVAREAVESANELAASILRLELLELQFQRFMRDSRETRRVLNERLEEAETEIGIEVIYAPFDGVLTAISSLNANATVASGHRFFSIADDSQLNFYVNALPIVMRYGNIHPILDLENGITFYAKVVSDPLAFRPPDSMMDFTLRPIDEDALLRDLAELGMDYYDFAISARLQLTATDTLAYDTLFVHTQAIRIGNRREYVYIYNDGLISRRYIVRGIQFTHYVQILMGLEEGQRIVVL